MTETKAKLAELKAQMHARPNLYSLSESEWRAEMEERKLLGRQIRELEKAEAAEKEALKKALWAPARIDPVPFFAELRDIIVNGPEPPKRTPKWRFRVASDFALQIQAKDKTRVLFEGLALEGVGINADSFAENRSEHDHLRQLKFEIRPEGEAWSFKPTYGYYGNVDVEKNEYGYQPRALVEEVGQSGLLTLKARIIEALGSIFREGEVPMLSDHCLMCGKALTDAVSRSRLIGPECAGKNSVAVPLFLKKKTVATVEQAKTLCHGPVGSEWFSEEEDEDGDIAEEWFFHYCAKCDAWASDSEDSSLPVPHVKDRRYERAEIGAPLQLAPTDTSAEQEVTA